MDGRQSCVALNGMQLQLEAAAGVQAPFLSTCRRVLIAVYWLLCALAVCAVCVPVQVVVEGWPEVGALPRLSELKDLLNVQEGFYFDYQDIIDDRRKLEL
jgi:hypothetical protein